MERAINPKVVIIGAGNVATHLASALSQHYNIVQIFSRNIKNAQLLASKFNRCNAINNISNIYTDADIYLVSLKDDAISEILAQIPAHCRNHLWLHTSGSISIDVFKDIADNGGVLYPLQTFSRNVPIEINEVPFLIEGTTPEVTDTITEIASHISSKVLTVDSLLRKRIHLSAVFACNFANHLWAIADEILTDANLSFELLHPLLKETLRKAIETNPINSQTGPARRGDTQIIDEHMSLLDSDKAMIYKILSQSIMSQYNIPSHE